MPIVASASFTRPANTTGYTSGDLVADNTVAASVTPLVFGMSRLGGIGTITRARLYKSSTTATAAVFTLRLFTAAQALTNGDNGAFAVADVDDLIGTVAMDLSSSALSGTAGLANQFAITGGITFDLPVISQAERRLYGYLVIGGSYAPASGETFRVDLEISNGM